MSASKSITFGVQLSLIPGSSPLFSPVFRRKMFENNFWGWPYPTVSVSQLLVKQIFVGFILIQTVDFTKPMYT